MRATDSWWLVQSRSRFVPDGKSECREPPRGCTSCVFIGVVKGHIVAWITHDAEVFMGLLIVAVDEVFSHGLAFHQKYEQ